MEATDTFMRATMPWLGQRCVKQIFSSVIFIGVMIRPIKLIAQLILVFIFILYFLAKKTMMSYQKHTLPSRVIVMPLRKWLFVSLIFICYVNTQINIINSLTYIFTVINDSSSPGARILLCLFVRRAQVPEKSNWGKRSLHYRMLGAYTGIITIIIIIIINCHHHSSSSSSSSSSS